jgi:hypothetical protein
MPVIDPGAQVGICECIDLQQRAKNVSGMIFKATRLDELVHQGNVWVEKELEGLGPHALQNLEWVEEEESAKMTWRKQPENLMENK